MISNRSWNFESFVRPRIIRDRSKLDNAYIPTKLPHREKQIEDIIRYLRPFYEGRVSSLIKIILNGPVGTGKTAVAKRIGLKLEEYSRRGKIPVNIRFSYVNGMQYRTIFQILRKMGSDAGMHIPRRGYSKDEVLEYLVTYLRNNDLYLIVTLDEADFLAQRDGIEAAEIFFSLSRLGEFFSTENYRVGIIFIFKRFYDSVMRLPKSVQSSMKGPIIVFPPYGSKQIEDILWARIREEGAIFEEAINDEIVSMIADVVGYDEEEKRGSGDARIAIEVLAYAAERAENEGRTYISPEDVRHAINKEVIPSPYSNEVLGNLTFHEKLLLLAIVRVLREEKERAYVPMGMVKLMYTDICNDYGIQHLKHTSIWEHIMALSKMELIQTRVSSKGSRGRTTLIQLVPGNMRPMGFQEAKIGISMVPLDRLERILLDLVKEEIEKFRS